jgi:hypothetical protein
MNEVTYLPNVHLQADLPFLLDLPSLHLDPIHRSATVRLSMSMGFYRLRPATRIPRTILQDQMSPTGDRQPRIRSMLVLV